MLKSNDGLIKSLSFHTDIFSGNIRFWLGERLFADYFSEQA